MFVSVIVATVAGQYAIVEYGGDFTSTVPLSQKEWVLTAAMGAASLPLGLVMRLFPVSESEASFAGEKTEGLSAVKKQGFVAKVINLTVILALMLGSYVAYEIVTEDEYDWNVQSAKSIVQALVDGWLASYNSLDNPDLDVVADVGVEVPIEEVAVAVEVEVEVEVGGGEPEL